MEIVLVIALVAVVGWWFVLREPKKDPQGQPVQEPAKVEESPLAPAWHTAPPKGTKPLPMLNPLDVNNDGKVNFDDVKAVVAKSKIKVKKTVDTRVAAKKAPARPAAKTPPASKTVRSKK